MSVYYLGKTMSLFNKLGEIDPFEMQLKYITRKKIEYEEEICSLEIKQENVGAKSEFVSFYDEKLKEDYK